MEDRARLCVCNAGADALSVDALESSFGAHFGKVGFRVSRNPRFTRRLHSIYLSGKIEPMTVKLTDGGKIKFKASVNRLDVFDKSVIVELQLSGCPVITE